MIVVGSIYYAIFISVVANFFSSLDQINVKLNKYDVSIEYYRKRHNIPDNIAFELRNYFLTHIKGKCFIQFHNFINFV